MIRIGIVDDHAIVRTGLRQFLSEQSDLSVTGDDFMMPCPGHLTSPFGPRRGRMHYGLDLKLQTGDPVISAFPGVVRISKYNKSYGHVVDRKSVV